MPTPKWFRRRHYLHFDLPPTVDQATPVVTNPTAVARHSFYPFIKSTITAIKLSRNRGTRAIVRQVKTREIAWAGHLDSHIYAYYGGSLSERYEAQIIQSSIEDSVLAFRTLGKSNIDFALAAFSEIASRPSCDVVALDIKGFFDNLDHKLLKKAWAGLLSLERLPPDHFCVFSSLTKWCWVNKKDLYAALGISVHNPKKGGRRRICAPDLFRTIVRGSNLLIRNGESKGIPQGSPMSALLSNIYMISFDQAMSTYTASVGAKYFRYCDDMIVIAPSGTGAAVKQFAQEQIKKVALEIQDEKTEQRTVPVQRELEEKR